MPNEISLVSLAKGLGSLTAACGALVAEAAAVCLEDQGHGSRWLCGSTEISPQSRLSTVGR